MCRFVTVNRTPGTGGFVISIGAFVQAYVGVIQEFATARTQAVPVTVMVGSTIDAHHPGHG